MQNIKLAITRKVQRSWTSKEFDRLQRIIISAAELSKCFAYPILHEPGPFQDIMCADMQRDAIKIFFDPCGLPLLTCVTHVKNREVEEIVLIVGPEGDLTHEEKDQLKQNGVMFCSLTPTVLRAHQAVALSAGVFRSI